MSKATSIFAALLPLALCGCLLPSYEKVDALDGAGDSDGEVVSALGTEGACGLSYMLPSECDLCIRQNCCELASECGQGTECGQDVLEQISPVADFTTDFDPLLGCMQRDCQQECDVNWGCLGEYEWPAPEDDYSFDVKVVDFAAMLDAPLPDVEIAACESVDPSCNSGRLDSGVSGEDGVVNLTVPADFEGFFSFSGGGYLDTTVQWTEPVHRLGDFTHYELTQDALDALALITGVHTSADDEFDPAAGHLIFRAQNCLPLRFLDRDEPPMAEVAGVAVDFEPNQGASQVFYTTDSGGVSVTQIATSTDAAGGAFNVPARNVSVRGIDLESGQVVSEGLVHVRPGAIGFSYLVPKSR